MSKGGGPPEADFCFASTTACVLSDGGGWIDDFLLTIFDFVFTILGLPFGKAQDGETPRAV
ncbi:MAG: hypothetical protein DRP66_06360 [Planctomycetota bacterium]|nr:MAG: hypothetical protein DRP66_06360 [Planctomycetota bacterium]